MTYNYFDTSCLMRRAEADVASPSSRNHRIAERVNELLDDPNTIVAISEHTLLEFHNNIAVDWRRSEASEFDQQWAERSLADVMQIIEVGQVEIVPIPPKAAEQAMALITIATRDHNNALRAWDAVHLLTATAWAYEVGSAVRLATTDGDFERFVSCFPHFKAYVDPTNLDY